MSKSGFKQVPQSNQSEQINNECSDQMTISDNDSESVVRSDVQEGSQNIFAVVKYPRGSGGNMKKNNRGRKQAELDSYRQASGNRIEQWKANIEKLKGGKDVSSIWEGEDRIQKKLDKNPVMKEWYNTMTAEDYKKMLRNRISALKSRVKKKEEEKELYALRRMKDRLKMCVGLIIQRDQYEALVDSSDSSFKKLLQQMKARKNSEV